MFKKVAKLFKRTNDSYDLIDYRNCGLQFIPPDLSQGTYQNILERLYLDSNQIRDLPKTLFSLHTLKKFTVSDNGLSELPSHIANLTSLKELDISKNGIAEIPDSIKCCKALAILDASVNPLKRLGDGFTQLLNLTELYLNDSYLDYLPANFGRLSNLKVLELRQNNLKTLPKSIGRLVELQHLDIGNNEFDDLPEEIGLFVNLMELWVDYNNLRTLPVSIRRLRKLEYLDAHYNAIEWLPEELAELENITYLDLSCNFLMELIEKVGNLRRLETLKLDENEIEYLPLSLGGLESLTEFSISGNDLEELPSTIGYLKKLRIFNADENYLFYLPSELGNCSALTILSLRCNHLEKVPDEIGRLIRLKVLTLSENRLQNLPHTVANLTQLSALWLSENQSKPLYPLQTDFDPSTKMRVLTCFLMPQPTYSSEEGSSQLSYSDEGSLHSYNRTWREQPIEYNRPNRIAFDISDNIEADEQTSRRRTPYPKDAKINPMQERYLMSRQVLDKDQHRKRLEQRQHDYLSHSDGSTSSPRHYGRHQPRSTDSRRPHHRDENHRNYNKQTGEYDTYSNGSYNAEVYHQQKVTAMSARYDSRNHHVSKGKYNANEDRTRPIENGMPVQRYRRPQDERSGEASSRIQSMTSPKVRRGVPDNDFRDNYPNSPTRRNRSTPDMQDGRKQASFQDRYHRRSNDHVDRVLATNSHDNYDHQNVNVVHREQDRARYPSPTKHSNRNLDINERSYVQSADKNHQNRYEAEVTSPSDQERFSDFTDGYNVSRQVGNNNVAITSPDRHQLKSNLNVNRLHGSMSAINNNVVNNTTVDLVRSPDNRFRVLIDDIDRIRTRSTQPGALHRSMTDITDHSGYTSPSNDKRRRALTDVTDIRRSLTASDIRYSTSNLYEGIASFASPDTASGKGSNYWWAKRNGDVADSISASQITDHEKAIAPRASQDNLNYQRGSMKNISNMPTSTFNADQHQDINRDIGQPSQDKVARSSHIINASHNKEPQKSLVKEDSKRVDSVPDSKPKGVKITKSTSREHIHVNNFDSNQKKREHANQDRHVLQNKQQVIAPIKQHTSKHEQSNRLHEEVNNEDRSQEVVKKHTKVTKERDKPKPARNGPNGNRRMVGYFHEDYDAEKEARILAWCATVEPYPVPMNDADSYRDDEKSPPMESNSNYHNHDRVQSHRTRRNKGEIKDGESNRKMNHSSSIMVVRDQRDNEINNEMIGGIPNNGMSADAGATKQSKRNKKLNGNALNTNDAQPRSYSTLVQHGVAQNKAHEGQNETDQIASNQVKVARVSPRKNENTPRSGEEKQVQKVSHRKHRERPQQHEEVQRKTPNAENKADPVDTEDSGFKFNVENLDDSESSRSLKSWVRQKMQVERDYAKENKLDDPRNYMYFPDSSDVEEQFYREQRLAAKRAPSSEGRSQASGPPRKPVVRPIESVLNSTLQQTFRVQIEKNPGLGFSISGGIGSPGNPYKPNDRGGIYVTRVLPNGSAATGVIPGDKLLQVNGHDLVDVTHPEAVAILKCSTSPVDLIIVRDYGQSL